MREIKFRAWLKETKELVTVFHWHKGDVLDYIEVLVSFNGSRRILADQYDLMQYTGLKDKYGTEIFESDIVKANLRHKDIEIIGRVSMPKSCWVVTFLNPTNGYFNNRRTAEFNELEIIGNIYENPELLPNTEQATEAKPLL